MSSSVGRCNFLLYFDFTSIFEPPHDYSTFDLTFLFPKNKKPSNHPPNSINTMLCMCASRTRAHADRTPLGVLFFLLKLTQQRVYVLEGGGNVLALLRTSEDDLPRNEDEEHYLGFNHPVDETREELRLVLRKGAVAIR